jgi:hypothetical protein
MNDQPIDLIHLSAIVIILSIGMGVIVWQIFKSEADTKANKKYK